MNKLKNFSYTFDTDAGPLSEETLKSESFIHGNCRRAIQYYLYKTKGLFLRSEEVLLPNDCRNVGEFIFREELIDFKQLKRGDVIYAENIRNKKGKPEDKSRNHFKNEDEWLMYLHTAIYLGELDDELINILPKGDYPQNIPLIWHATFIGGGTCVWTLDKFEQYYKVISVKRLFLN